MVVWETHENGFMSWIICREFRFISYRIIIKNWWWGEWNSLFITVLFIESIVQNWKLNCYNERFSKLFPSYSEFLCGLKRTIRHVLDKYIWAFCVVFKRQHPCSDAELTINAQWIREGETFRNYCPNEGNRTQSKIIREPWGEREITRLAWIFYVLCECTANSVKLVIILCEFHIFRVKFWSVWVNLATFDRTGWIIASRGEFCMRPG